MNVVEVSDGSVAVSYAGRLLADMGHSITKVEKPIGDSLRYRPPFSEEESSEGSGLLFMGLHADKRRVAIDWESSEGAELVRRLVADADGLLVGGHLSGRDYHAQFADIAARAVAVYLTGYGVDGAYSTAPCYSLNAQAHGGVAVGIGRPRERPLSLPFDLGEYQLGLAGAIGMLTGARASRDAPTDPVVVDIAESDVWATCHTGQNILTYLYLGVSGLRNGNHGVGLYPNTFLPCKDGYACITLTPLAQWMRLIEIMGDPDWTRDARFRARRAMTEEYPEEADAHVSEWLEDMTRERLLDIALGEGLPVVPAFGVQDVLENEHLAARGAWKSLFDGERELRLPSMPFRDADEPSRHIERAVERWTVGADTVSVLSQIGVSRRQIVTLYECGVI